MCRAGDVGGRGMRHASQLAAPTQRNRPHTRGARRPTGISQTQLHQNCTTNQGSPTGWILRWWAGHQIANRPGVHSAVLFLFVSRGAFLCLLGPFGRVVTGGDSGPGGPEFESPPHPPSSGSSIPRRALFKSAETPRLRYIRNPPRLPPSPASRGSI